MKQNILKTTIGSFWLESNYQKISFEIEELKQDIKERLIKKTSLENFETYLLKPDNIKIEDDFYIVSDIDFSKWKLDNYGSGQDLVNYCFLNESNLKALGVGIETKSDDNEPEFIKDKARLKLGYKDLSSQNKSDYKVAISIGSYESKELLTSEEVDITVFLSL